MTYDRLIAYLENNKNFSFSRWGDGEFNAILGSHNESNCDKHYYFKDMGMRLYHIIQSYPEYDMGLQPLVKKIRKDDPDFKILTEAFEWSDADIIHKASIAGDLERLFKALYNRDIIFVGNINLVEATWNFKNIRNMYRHIIISETDCWLEYNDILERLKANIIDDVVILYAASMPTEVLIDDIYQIYGESITQIDIGSAFDPYSGIISRSYHKKLKI